MEDHAEKPRPENKRGLSRRAFVGVLAVGTGVNLVAGGALDGLWTDAGRHTRLVIAALRRHLSGLGFSETDFHRFARDRIRREPMDSREYKFSFAWPVYAWTNILQERANLGTQIENWEEKLITQFLLSTNYFEADRRQAPVYRNYYAPGKEPCRNPFARLRNPDEAVGV